MAKWLYGFMVIWLVVFPVKVRAYEAITEFDSRISINKDTSLTITETINYETDEDHHGIYRYIPLEYRVDGRIVKAPISRIKVTDELGNNLQYTQSRENKNLKLKIGDPNTTFTGSKTFQITYRVEEALKQFPNQDELYWDITGEGWQIPIDKVSAQVDSPHAQIIKTACYAGAVGGDDGQCSNKFTDKSASFNYDEGIGYNDNVTIAVGLNKANQLVFPSTTDKLIKNITANWWLPLIFLPMIIMAIYWYLSGRDYVFISPNVFDLDPAKPQIRKPLVNGSRVPFVYEPLTQLTPGEAGAIIDEKVNNSDVVAEIIDLARKKYLKISREETKVFFGKKTDYIFEKLNTDESKLPKHQQTIMSGIFKSADKVELSKLKGKFYTTQEIVKKEIEDSLTKRKLYVTNPNFSRIIGLIMAVSANILIFLIIGSALAFVQSALWYGLFAAGALISLIFGYNITQKTAVGSNLSMQAAGLKRTILYGKWREEIKEKNLFIEEVLPFAVALGVVNKLASDMKDLGLEPPKYFSEPGNECGDV